MHLRDFKSRTAFASDKLADYDRAYVEFWGEGTYRWVGWHDVVHPAYRLAHQLVELQQPAEHQ